MCSTSCTSPSTFGMCVCSWLRCSAASPPSPPFYWRGSCGTRALGCSRPASSPSSPATSPAQSLAPSTMKASQSLPCSSPTISGYACRFCITFHNEAIYNCSHCCFSWLLFVRNLNSQAAIQNSFLPTTTVINIFIWQVLFLVPIQHKINTHIMFIS